MLIIPLTPITDITEPARSWNPCALSTRIFSTAATSWTTKSAYGKATSVNLSPATATTYTVKVDVKDSDGTVVSKTFTIKVS